ncbi:MAG TPA: hypothetical protein VMR73_00790 [Candidatus Paceibacterota bacterium]|nr:hypothetical protein [Candidatus Paceibacterota bacterium]
MSKWEEVGFFALIFAGIFLFWVLTGGPERATSSEGMFLKAPVEAGGTGQVYGGTAFQNGLNIGGTSTTIVLPNTGINFGTGKKATIPNNVPHSNFWDELSFDGVSGAKNASTSTEYLRLIAGNNIASPLTITGFVVGSFASGNLATITTAALLPILGSPYSESSIYVSPGDVILLSTEISPIKTSFRVNKCSGFLNQLYSFTPAILKLCPTASALLTKFGPANDTSCIAYAKTVPQCTAVASSAVPINLSSACKTFVEQTLTYNGCVESTQNDSDFYENEYRVFLGSQNELWGNSTDAIGLFDTKGGLVGGLTY